MRGYLLTDPLRRVPFMIFPFVTVMFWTVPLKGGWLMTDPLRTVPLRTVVLRTGEVPGRSVPLLMRLSDRVALRS